MAKSVSVRVKSKWRALKIFSVILIVLLLIAGLLEAGVFAEHFLYRPYAPDYKKEDISSLLEKEERSEQDYQKLYAQTGLSAAAIEDILKKHDKDFVLEIQEDFFAGYKVNSEQFAPFTCYHYIDKNIKTAPLKDGDIIVTPTTHFSVFRLGHASILSDAENGEMVSATGYMRKSYIEGIFELTDRPAFVILRPKNRQAAQKAAKFAGENLTDLQYSVSVGLTAPKFPERADRTQCGHLVWYAYKKQGIDIDSNGGPFVFPSDILNSPELEVVQVYGMDPLALKK